MKEVTKDIMRLTFQLRNLVNTNFSSWKNRYALRMVIARAIMDSHINKNDINEGIKALACEEEKYKNEQ